MGTLTTHRASFIGRLLGSPKDQFNFAGKKVIFSRIFYQFQSECDHQKYFQHIEWTDEQLTVALEDAFNAQRTLNLENEVFERHLLRKDPQRLESK